MKRYIKSDEMTNQQKYREIYDRVIAHEQYNRGEGVLGLLQAIAISAYSLHYGGVTNMRDAVFEAMELLEPMTGKWYDPTQEEFDDLVNKWYI